jgi:membrane protease YdiL (CAAX protease family)
LQSALDDRWPPKLKVLGAEVGYGLLVSSAIFALGHIATEPQWSRLAVFFPSLLFGWLKARVRGVGTPALFHASCNVFSAHLARGFGYLSVS